MYRAVGHFSGQLVREVNVTSQLPWVYAILAPAEAVVYIGESYDTSGIVVRLSSHFGPFTQSTLKQRSAEILCRPQLRPPFFCVAARLPAADDSKVDASSKKIRLAIEAIVHQRFAESFIPQNAGWLVLSQAGGSLAPTTAMAEIAESIFGSMLGFFSSNMELMKASPFNLILLNRISEIRPLGQEGLEEMIRKCEVKLFMHLRSLLQKSFGDRWWTEGVPEKVRTECAQKREQEGTYELYPSEAYLSLIDLRDIAMKNWELVRSEFERIGGGQGKDKGTSWIRELNETRKIWAHPLKQLHVTVDSESEQRIAEIYGKIRSILGG